MQFELGLPTYPEFIEIIEKILLKAFIDLGTNTFHCKIVFIKDNGYDEIFYDKTFVKIGEGGISKGLLTPEAIQRAERALIEFQEVIVSHNVKEVMATGTSALRNAKNNSILIDLMKGWNWNVEIIEGKREAELIYKGILLDSLIPQNKKSIIMDIGGGSVEFIIGIGGKIEWSQSFEIGAQRLKDQFHKSDPIQIQNINALFIFLQKILSPLKEALEKYNPEIFIGSSGTFDTILSIKNEKTDNDENNIITLTEFHKIKMEIVNSSFEERLKFPGMVIERAEMIVTASLLLEYVLKLISITKIFVSSNALKEGLIYEEINRTKS